MIIAIIQFMLPIDEQAMIFCSRVLLRLLHPPMIDKIALFSNRFRLMNDETQYKSFYISIKKTLESDTSFCHVNRIRCSEVEWGKFMFYDKGCCDDGFC